MKFMSHRCVVKLAFKLLAEDHPEFSENESLTTMGVLWPRGIANSLARETGEIDHLNDIEFVDVEATSPDEATDVLGGRDLDPHGGGNDEPHYKEFGRSLTAYNHFIDIKKGKGLFDDFDGYSYEHGSASRDEYQPLSDVTKGESLETPLVGDWPVVGEITNPIYTWAVQFAIENSGAYVDEGFAWYFNDEYVHAPGHPFYKDGECSPAIERYSRWKEVGKYDTLKTESKARFPLAEVVGREDCGIPFSVFLPVDNMALYWHREFLNTADPLKLAGVFHAIQDAVVPHHAAGYMGNWHVRYEDALETRFLGNWGSALNSLLESNPNPSYNDIMDAIDSAIEGFGGTWFNDEAFRRLIKEKFERFNRLDEAPPESLVYPDGQAASFRNHIPARNWSIDMLVTWLAMCAYEAYENAWQSFSSPSTVYHRYIEEELSNPPPGYMRWSIEDQQMWQRIVLNSALNVYYREIERLFDNGVPSMKVLTANAVAITMLVLAGAAEISMKVDEKCTRFRREKDSLRIVTIENCFYKKKWDTILDSIPDFDTLRKEHPDLDTLRKEKTEDRDDLFIDERERGDKVKELMERVQRILPKNRYQLIAKAGDLETPGDRVLVSSYNKECTKRALEVIKHYKMSCRCTVGSDGKPVMTYYKSDPPDLEKESSNHIVSHTALVAPGKGIATALKNEDCIEFDPDRLRIVSDIPISENNTRYYIYEDNRLLKDLGTNLVDAQKALAIIKKYKFTRLCFVGKPETCMEYFRVAVNEETQLGRLLEDSERNRT